MYEDPSSLASISKRLNSICYTCLPFLTSPRKSHNIKTHPDISCQNVHVQSIIVILVDYFEDEVMTIVYCLDRFEVFRLLISLLVGLDSTGVDITGVMLDNNLDLSLLLQFLQTSSGQRSVDL